MKNKQSGFTLIELVVVIVILGILAVTAIPKFVDLSDQAAQAAVEGVAGALSSGSAINYATCKADPAHTECETVTDCQDADATLQSGVMPAGYTIATATVAVDAAVSCTVSDGATPANTASFTAIGTP